MENAITVKPTLLSTLSKEDYTQMHAGSIDNMLQVRVVASFLAGSKLLPASLKGDQNTAIALVLMAKQMNLPITALSEVCEINGKIGFWGRTRLGIIMRDPRCEYALTEENTDEKCVIVARRSNWPKDKEVRITYTAKQAELAGLMSRETYKKHPADMLYWRAVSRLASQVFPDVIQGMASLEDIQDGVVEAEISEEGLQAPKQIEAPKEKKTKGKQVPIAPQPAQGIETPAETEPETIEVEGESVNVETGEVVSEPIADTPAVLPEVLEEEQKKEIFRVVERISTLPAQTATGLETVRKVVCKNDLIPGSPSESYSLGSLEMAAALKRLQGTKVKLSIYKGAVVSFEEMKF